MNSFRIIRKAEGYRFLFETADETILVSKLYATRTTCLNGIVSVRRNAARAEIDKGINPQFIIEQEANGAVSFLLAAPNGQIVARSLTYQGRAACMRTIEILKNGISDAVILNEDGSEP